MVEVPEVLRCLIEPDKNGCWIWTGKRDRYGYGRSSTVRCGTDIAHRYVYELLVGPIPEGLTIDHLCRVNPCVRPTHLEPVTAAENTRRMFEAKGSGPYLTHCKHGHEFTPDNTYEFTKYYGVTRNCRTCQRTRSREWARRNRAKARDAAAQERVAP